MKKILNGNNLLNDNTHRLGILKNTLKKHTLDELPELVNVVRGDISLWSDPAFLLCKVIFPQRYNEHQSKGGMKCVPGLTGYAQYGRISALGKKGLIMMFIIQIT